MVHVYKGRRTGFCQQNIQVHVFLRKPGSGHGTKSFLGFLNLTWNFVHFSTKSFLIGFLFFNVELSMSYMFLDI